MRAFLALDLEPAAVQFAREQQNLARQQSWADRVRWVRPEDMHVTMRFLGEDIPDALVETVRVAVRDAVSAEPAGFGLVLAQASFFPNPSHPRVVVCRVERSLTLLGWAGRLEKLAVAAGLPAERKSFDAHVTLGRCRPGFPTRPTMDIPAARLESSAGAITLYRSELTAHGPQYTPIERFALTQQHA